MPMTLARQLILHNTRVTLRISPPFRRQLHLTTVRHVKVKRPWVRRFLTTCLLYGAAIQLWSTFVLVQFDGTLHSGDTSIEHSQGPESADENSIVTRSKGQINNIGEPTDSTSLFVPLSLPHLREGNFYAVSDPEWQAFIKISRDRERLQALKDELAAIVLGDASQSALLLRMLGGPFTVTGFWLVHHFPSRAPPVYYRSGLELTEAGVSWSSKAMSLDDGARLQRCMRPIFVALAIQDACMVFWRSILSKFNVNSSDDERAPSLSNLSYKTSLTSDFKPLSGLSDLMPSNPQIAPHVSPQSSTSRKKGDSNLHSSIILSTLQRLPLPRFGPGSDLYTASLAFKWRLNECWERESRAHNRGSFYVVGPVGIKGSKGFCRVEVRGEYDPTTSKWTSVSMQLKDFSIFNQKALGGQ